jgi:PAS domain S-box-containing protein
LVPGGSGQYEAEFPIVLPSGEERWLVARARGQFVGRGKKRRVTAVIGSALDITQQKRAEEVLRKSEEHFRQLADNAPVLIWMDDADNRAVYVNAEFTRFLGRSAEELLGDGWRDLIHPDDADSYFDSFVVAAAKRERFEGEFRFRRRDGEYRWVRSIGVPRFENGVYLGYVGTTTDIHGRKMAEDVQALRESLERQGRQQAELLAAISGELEVIDSADGRARRLTELLVPGFAKFASVQLPGNDAPVASTGLPERVLSEGLC